MLELKKYERYQMWPEIPFGKNILPMYILTLNFLIGDKALSR
jgi:hypothetical protein